MIRKKKPDASLPRDVKGFTETQVTVVFHLFLIIELRGNSFDFKFQ